VNIFESAKRNERLKKLDSIFSFGDVQLYVKNIKELIVGTKTYQISDFETLDELKLFFYDNFRKIKKIISENINFIDIYHLSSGKLHNKYGPAYIRIHKRNSEMIIKLFFKKGKQVQEKDVLKKSRDSKLNRVFKIFLFN
jgi:hypothetical protein